MAISLVRASSQYLYTNALSLAGWNFTLFAWLKHESTSSTDILAGVSAGDKDDTNNSSNLEFRNPGGSGNKRWMAINIDNGGSNDTTLRSTNNSITQSVWYPFVGVFKGQNDIDVRFDTTVSTTENTTGSGADPTLYDRFTIGVRSESSPVNFWEGWIAEVAIWNVALNSQEQKILTDRFSPAFVRPGNLLGYYPLGGPFGENFNCVRGSLGTLTTSGSPTWTRSGARDHPPVRTYPSSIRRYVTPELSVVSSKYMSFLPF